MTTSSGYTTHKHLKTKLVAGITAIAGLLTIALPFGAASADSYSSMGNSNYGNRGYVSKSYSQSNNYNRNNNYRNTGYVTSSYNRNNNYNTNYSKYPVRYSSYNDQYMQRYSNYRWVYDPCLHRWVMIRYNSSRQCWEYCDSGQRYVGQVY
jgi:hypothetical protein